MSEGQEMKWYVIHTYAGYEKKVQQSLQNLLRQRGLEDRVGRIVVPVKKEVRVRDGRRRQVERRLFPGYILIQMALDDDLWHLILRTPGVTGFVGPSGRPVPLPEEEVQAVLAEVEEKEPALSVDLKVGEVVQIIDGPFRDFEGTVAEIDEERGKVKVLVSFFGRETPVEIDFLQVKRVVE